MIGWLRGVVGLTFDNHRLSCPAALQPGPRILSLPFAYTLPFPLAKSPRPLVPRPWSGSLLAWDLVPLRRAGGGEGGQ